MGLSGEGSHETGVVNTERAAPDSEDAAFKAAERIEGVDTSQINCSMFTDMTNENNCNLQIHKRVSDLPYGCS